MKTSKLYSFAILYSLAISQLAYAAPEGGKVVAGSADIAQAGTRTTINQSSPSAVINRYD